MFKLNQDSWKNAAFQAAVKLDLFTFLDRSPGQALTAGELAKEAGGEERATGMLATALVAMGLLERDGQRLRNTPSARRYLSLDSEEYFGHMIKHGSHILPAWLKLEEGVRTGSSVVQASASAAMDEDVRESFLMAMYNVARLQAASVAEALDLRDARGLLDLGGGPGTYAGYFCLKNPQLKAVVFDRPTTGKFAIRTLERLGVADRVAFVGGDIINDPLPQGFEAVWLSQVIHSEGPEGAFRMIKKAADSLVPGGLMAIQEFYLEDDLSGPLMPALFALNMLLQTPGGQAYTFSEVKAMMRKAGIADPKPLPAKLPPGAGILAGRKE
jgi:hypothetical protein